MPSASTEQVLAASRQWLIPLVHVLLRCGITWRDFSELAKTTFVEVATESFGKRGRPTNVSRTAVLTGLMRREVRRQRKILESAPAPLRGHVTKGSLVLSAWHLDPEFLDSNTGKPAPLPLKGETASFAALVRRCGGSDVPLTTLVKELRQAGAIRRRADGRLEALKRDYIPHAMDEELIRLWGTVLADIGTTYVHNLTREAATPARFERAAVNDRIDPKALPAFRAFLELEGQSFLERLDAWLTEHQVPAETPQASRAPVRLGVGVYHIQD
jgi:hypothetical protein